MEINEKVVFEKMGNKVSVVLDEKVGTVLCTRMQPMMATSIKLSEAREAKLAGILMNHLLEKGHFDKAIKGWISANMLDGDAFNDCGKTKLTLTPEELYETIYDCVDGITGV